MAKAGVQTRLLMSFVVLFPMAFGGIMRKLLTSSASSTARLWHFCGRHQLRKHLTSQTMQIVLRG